MSKCENCPSRNLCKINKRGNCLPDLADEIGYPLNSNDFKWHKMKEKMVPVDLMIGGFSSCRRDEYDNNWHCIEPDHRWLRLLDSVRKKGYDNSGKFGFPVDLVEFEGKYYVARDGYRRVSLAKLLKIEKIKAWVTRLEMQKK